MENGQLQDLVAELVRSTFAGADAHIAEAVLKDREDADGGFALLSEVLERCGGDTRPGVKEAWDHLVKFGEPSQAGVEDDPAFWLAQRVCSTVVRSDRDVATSGAGVRQLLGEFERLEGELSTAGNARAEKCWSPECLGTRVTILGQMLAVSEALAGHTDASAEVRRHAQRRRRVLRAQYGLASGRLALPWVTRGSATGVPDDEVALYRVATEQPGPRGLHGLYVTVREAMAASGYPSAMQWVSGVGAQDVLISDSLEDGSVDEVLWVIEQRGATQEYVRLLLEQEPATATAGTATATAATAAVTRAMWR